MKEMLMLIAASMSKESIMERLYEAVDDYKEAKLLDNEEKIEQADKDLFVAINLYLMHFTTKGDIKQAMEHIKTMGEIEKAHNFFKTEKN